MNLILGSRTYAPLSDVDKEVSDGDFSFGISDVAERAEKAGARRKPLETTRKTLLELAKAGGDVVLFVARDPKTKQPTSGMASLQLLLEREDIPFRIISSPFPGSICSMVTELRHSVDATVKWPAGARKDAAMAKALQWAGIVTDKRNEYATKLEESKDFEVGNDELDERWVRWVNIYTELEDALEDAKRMLA